MTIHFVSVGLSIRDEYLNHSSRVRDTVGRGLAAAISSHHSQLFREERLADISDWLTSALTTGDSPERAQLERLVAAVEPARWPASASAELSTIAATPSGTARIDSADLALLVTTDTKEGVQAALWNALALTGGAVDRVHYLPAPGPPAPDLSDRFGDAVIVRIPGLDAGTDRGFRQAMRGLGHLGRAALNASEQRTSGGDTEPGPFLFHLSGGFKAAIPYLIGLAEGIRGFSSGQVQAQVLHENTRDRPIRLPLRCLSRGLVSSVLARADEKGILKFSSTDMHPLRGYCYELNPEKEYQLTAFGEGLRALFGPEPER